MVKLKMNQHVPNINADFLKKISLMETEVGSGMTDTEHSTTSSSNLK